MWRFLPTNRWVAVNFARIYRALFRNSKLENESLQARNRSNTTLSCGILGKLICASRTLSTERDLNNICFYERSNSYEKVQTFKYLGSLLTNQNSIHKEIKCRLKTGNSFYYSVKTLSSPQLLSKNLKIKIYKSIVLIVMLYDCETWSLILREEHRLRVLENNIIRHIFGPKRDDNKEWRRHYTELHSTVHLI